MTASVFKKKKNKRARLLESGAAGGTQSVDFYIGFECVGFELT